MKKRISVIISIIVIVGVIVGVTLALFRKNIFTQNVSFNVDGITITYEAGDNITGVKLIPVTTLAKGLTDGTAIEKTITVSSTEKADFNLYLDVEILDNGLKKYYVKYQINKGNNIVGSGNFANTNAGDTITLLSNEEINSRNSVYKLYIWIDGSVPNSMDVFEQNYKFVLRATASSKNQVKTNSSLPDFILDSNAPLDSVNSAYVTGITNYSLSSEEKATLRAFIISDGTSSEQADQCIAGVIDGCLDYYLGKYNEANDPDIEIIKNNIPGIDFSKPSDDTNGQGLYIRSGTENDKNPIYYYRGDVDNNNVYFGGYYWRIVRTTETGGLKMIYNGKTSETNSELQRQNLIDKVKISPLSDNNPVIITSIPNIGCSAFNTNNDDSKYVGYTYDNNGVETDSTIKGVIDTWYQNNILANYDNYIEDTVYCNDREEASASEIEQIESSTGTTMLEKDIIYKPYVRLTMTGIPSLECSNSADKYTKSESIGNGKLTYPIGLLTTDEGVLSGFLQTKNSSIDSSFWFLSPMFFADDKAYINNGYPANVSTSSAVLPVITLKPEYNTFSYGDGTISNPYRFVETAPSLSANNDQCNSGGGGLILS